MTPAKPNLSFRKAAPLNAINVLALILGFIQQLAVVRFHGASAVADFYFLLIIVPQVLINLANSIVNNAIQPFILLRRERSGGESEDSLIKTLAIRLWVFAGLAAALAMGIGAMQGVHAAAWNQGRIDVLAMLGCAPFLLVFGVLNSLYTTVLQSRRDYWPGFVGFLLSPALGIVFGVALASFGVWPFVAGQGAGMMAQFFWLRHRALGPSSRSAHTNVEISLGESRELRSKIVALFVVGIGFQFLPFVERSMAQKGETGSVAAIALATRLGTSISPIIVSATASMLFTTFAELAAAGNSREAVLRLLEVLARLQWALTGLVLVGPFILAQILPFFIAQPALAKSILHVFPDYLFAGCVSAAGSLSIGCYYSVFKSFRFQLYAIYGSLLFYAALLAAPFWTPVSFSLRVISFADAVYFALSVTSVTLYVSHFAGRVFPWRYILSFTTLCSAWLMTRFFF